MKNVFILALGLFVSSAQADVINGFTAEYDASKWQIIEDGGSAEFTDVNPVDGVLDTLTQISANDGVLFSNDESFTDTIFLDGAHTDGYVSFDWLYNTADEPEWDIFGWLLNDVFTPLSDISPSASDIQSGSEMFVVNSGDIFGFRTYSPDSAGGSSVTEISNFSFTEVPEPSSIAFFALLCAYISFNRKQKA